MRSFRVVLLFNGVLSFLEQHPEEKKQVFELAIVLKESVEENRLRKT